MEPDKCPCCGSDTEVRYGRTQRETWAYVVCLGCGLHTANHHGKKDKEAKSLALEAWNRRVWQCESCQ